MLEKKTIKETGVLYESMLTGIDHPVILEQNKVGDIACQPVLKWYESVLGPQHRLTSGVRGYLEGLDNQLNNQNQA